MSTLLEWAGPLIKFMFAKKVPENARMHIKIGERGGERERERERERECAGVCGHAKRKMKRKPKRRAGKGGGWVPLCG